MFSTNNETINLEPSNSQPFYSQKGQFRFLYLTASLAILFLLLIVGGSLFWDIRTNRNHMRSMVKDIALAHFNKDQAFRLWSASHGGVYVPASEHTPPNPYLSHLPERDIETPSGRKLTLMNPAYMVRQLMDDFQEMYHIRGRITSLRPLNPVNAADEWEIKALEAFENGAEEFTDVVEINGTEFLRFMRPMVTDQPCLKCHSQQGYVVGDIRGGVGVSIPFAPYQAWSQDEIKKMTFSHLAMAGLGIITIVILSLQGKKRIIERARIVGALRESEEQWRSITSTSPDYIIRLDNNLTIQFINRTEPGLTLGDVLGKPLYSLAPEEQQEPVREALQRAITEHHPVSYETTYTRPDGETVYFESVAAPIFMKKQVNGLTVSSRDITDRKVAEQHKKEVESRLRQAQKMESIGILAGGIAHDFNNILSIILGYTDMAREALPPESSAKADLDQVIKASNRARNLVKQVLTFSRQTEDARQYIQPHLIIKEALKMLRSTIPTTIELRQNIDSQCGAIFADPTNLHQIVMNLCTNAYHSMRETGGILAVTLKPVELAADDHKTDLEILPGPYIMLEVSDTGCGMDNTTMDKIFNPYFTTKKLGEGTGLGLSVVHGIVKSYNGHIAVYSEPGKGATFKVYLPRITLGENAEPPLEKVSIPGGTEKILLVDDEGILVAMEQQMLANLGYEVIAETSSSKALKTFQRAPKDFDLVITDMTMPGLTGVELCQRIIAIRPDIPLILCTGFSELVNDNKAKAAGFHAYLEKPVIKKDLAQVVRDVLDGKSIHRKP